MLARIFASLLFLAALPAAAYAQKVDAQKIDLDAFARKVAQETIRSLREAGALKEPASGGKVRAATASRVASPDDGLWQTSTSMKPTSGHPAKPINPSFKNDLADSAAPRPRRKISGLEAGIEAVIAKPILGQEHGGSCCNTVSRTPNHGASISPRVWLSWFSEEGYGLRARYFDLSSTSDTYEDADGWAKERLKYATADFELAYHDTWVNWDVIWSLGARYLDMTTRAEVNRNGNDTTSKVSTFKGVGPMASLELRRRTDSGFAPFALFRGGFVAGEVRTDTDVSDDFLYVVDDVFDYYEASAGFEYQRAWGSTTLFFRGAVEAMYMPRAANILDGTNDQQEDNQHLAILGGTVSFGARF
ncbi:MAG: hypothetical protein AAF709_11770 [Pseudomonadota bacterium]